MTTPTKFSRAKPPRLQPAEVKAIVRYRDGYRCTQCGMTAREHVLKYKITLEVHRLIPGSRYTVKGCISLCRKCHGPQPRLPTGTRRSANGRLILGRVIRPELMDGLRKLSKRNRRTITAELELALERALEDAGIAVPPEDDTND